jgi:hypothetical protein
MKKIIAPIMLSLSIMLVMLPSSSFAKTGIGLTRGFNGVDGMNGFGLDYNSYWGNITNINNKVELTGLWKFNLSYWHSNSSQNIKYGNITVGSIIPVFRLQRRFAFDNGISPFADLGYGVALFNRNQFSNQKLGAYGSFVFSAGAGLNFGPQSQYDLSYHYTTYDNQDQFKDNDGMYINAITFTYHFAD